MKHKGHKDVTMGPAHYASFNCTQCKDEILVSNKVIEEIEKKTGAIPPAQAQPVSPKE